MQLSEMKYDYSTWIKLLSDEVLIYYDDLFFKVSLRYVDQFNLAFVIKINLKNEFVLKHRLNFSGLFTVKRLGLNLPDNLYDYYPKLELFFQNENNIKSLNTSLKELIKCFSESFKEKIQQEVKFLDIDFNYKSILNL